MEMWYSLEYPPIAMAIFFFIFNFWSLFPLNKNIINKACNQKRWFYIFVAHKQMYGII